MPRVGTGGTTSRHRSVTPSALTLPSCESTLGPALCMSGGPAEGTPPPSIRLPCSRSDLDDAKPAQQILAAPCIDLPTGSAAEAWSSLGESPSELRVDAGVDDWVVRNSRRDLHRLQR